MKTKKQNVKCPYCGGIAVLRNAGYVYGDKSKRQKLYVCQHYPECNSYVGVHDGTDIPMGTLANGDLRNKRIQAHHAFDRIWKYGILTKKNAYRWIQDKFSLRPEQAHIGFFSEYMCDRLIEESNIVLKNNKEKIRGEYCGQEIYVK